MQKLLWILVLGIGVHPIIQAQTVEMPYNPAWNPDSLVNLSYPKFTRFLELGISANAYQGDLSSYQHWTAVYHLGIKFNQSGKLNSRLGISTGFLTGENRFYAFPDGTPNNFFRASVISIDYELHFHLIKRRNCMLYLSQGISLIRFNPKNDVGNEFVNLTDTRAIDETYGNIAFALPTGIGAAYILKNGYGIGAQAQILNLQSDYLDNIGLWGVKQGNDNALRFKLFVYAPLKIIPAKPFKTPIRKKSGEYSHDIY
jgi:hypothetical protein